MNNPDAAPCSLDMFDAENGTSQPSSRPEPVPIRRTPVVAVAIVVIAMAAIMLAGYVGYWAVRRPSSKAARAVETAQTNHTAEISPAAPDDAAPETITHASPKDEIPAPASASQADSASPHSLGERADVAFAAPLPLAVKEATFSPSFDPTGRALFFHAGRIPSGRLLQAELDRAAEPLRVSTVLADSARNYHVRESPDQQMVAFDSDRDGERGVYIARSDGSDARRVSGQGFAAVPSWSSDMKWLAFVRSERHRPHVWNLWMRNLDTGALARITSYQFGQVWGASWFADARRLCYSHEDQLVIRDIVSRKTDVFRTPRAGHLVRTPAVSPDGQRVIFQVFRDGVWMLDLHTRGMARILDDSTAEEFAWDPKGQRVAYHSRKNGRWQIWMATVPTS